MVAFLVAGLTHGQETMLLGADKMVCFLLERERKSKRELLSANLAQILQFNLCRVTITFKRLNKVQKKMVE